MSTAVLAGRLFKKKKKKKNHANKYSLEQKQLVRVATLKSMGADNVIMVILTYRRLYVVA